MGFIDYRGDKESHYDDVVEYVKIREEQERRKRDERKKAAWFARVAPWLSLFSAAPSKALLGQTAVAYRKATDEYRKMQIPAGLNGEDSLQIWQDLWLSVTSWCVDILGVDEEKKVTLLQTLTEKMLHLEGHTSAETHLIEVKKNRQYKRYIRTWFTGRGTVPPAYWAWLSRAGNPSGTVAVLDGCREYCLLLAYYLYTNTYPESDKWMKETEDLLGRFEAAKKQCLGRTVSDNVPRNPLYQNGCKEGPLFRQILLFGGKYQIKEEGEEMTEDLYAFLKESGVPVETGSSILPEDIRRQIKENRLPVFSDPSITGLQPGEAIHFVDHAVFYVQEEEDRFRLQKGILAVTDKRIAFRSAGFHDILIKELSSMTRYDMKPVIFKFQGEETAYVTLPDADLAYQVLWMVSDKQENAADAVIPVTYSYRELVEKADLAACIAAFESLEGYGLSEELEEKTSSLIRKARALKKAVEAHPEKAEETKRFLEYYLPEAYDLIRAYREYQETALEEKVLLKTQRMIRDSLDTLDAAVEDKIMDLYQMEALETRARADALKKVLEQDGYSKEKPLFG